MSDEMNPTTNYILWEFDYDDCWDWWDEYDDIDMDTYDRAYDWEDDED